MAEVPVVVLPKGQKIAACVPYEDKNDEWILAEVVSFQESDLDPFSSSPRKSVGTTCPTYIVKDLFPENKNAVRSWKVTPHRVIALPGPSSFDVGDAVLALWFLSDDKEWSTMFYPGNIVESPSSKENHVKLKYLGDEDFYDVEVDKVVRQPPESVDMATEGAVEISSSKKRPPPTDNYTSSIGLSDMELTRRTLYTYHMCGVLGKKIRRRETSGSDSKKSANVRT